MRRLMKGSILAVLTAVLVTGAPALAEPRGNGPQAGPQGQWNNGTPPGFSKTQGQKKGWQGNTSPRGWTSGKGQKKGWDRQSTPKGIGKKQ
jgi:hypothetical protein